MNINYTRVDLRKEQSKKAKNMSIKNNELSFKLNHTLPFSDEYYSILKKLFKDKLGKNSTVSAPIYGTCFDKVTIGNNVFINSNILLMARGEITIEDDVKIAANVQLITNNHDEYEREILTCKPIIIEKGAWIGAGSTILPGIKVGKYSIVGAASVVTKDVPDYAVVVGNPAKIIKILDKDKFDK